MSISFHIETSIGIVFCDAQGPVSDQDLLLHQQRLREHPDFRSDYRQLCDFRDADLVAVSAACLKQLAYHDAFDDGARRAIVVDGDFAFGLARQFQALTGSRPEGLAVFRELTEAREWLGLKETAAE